MEVHHHPQVEKKNFREYFLEFLMIFLAVTMGFLQRISENILLKPRLHVKTLKPTRMTYYKIKNS